MFFIFFNNLIVIIYHTYSQNIDKWCIYYLGDEWLRDFTKVERVLFVSGKHYYALHKKREELGRTDVAIIRLEELCPFPTYYLQKQFEYFKKAKRK